MKIVCILIQTIVMIAAAPLLSGLIRKMKNTMRMRRGPGVFQPYYNFIKLWGKGEVVSPHASWIFGATPAIVLGGTVAATFLVPLSGAAFALTYMGDFILLLFFLALGRFFLALAALDTGSAFGGMGASREMFISSLVEPVAMLSLFAVALNAHSTDMDSLASVQFLHLSSIVAALAFLSVTIAETSRIPVDNQETHLELTMVHEAMVLEYSGRSLALVELAAQIKQMIFFVLFANVMLPCVAGGSLLIYTGTAAAKMLALAFAVSVIEVSAAKMRLFRVVDFLSFSMVIACMAVVLQAMGW